MKLVIVVCEECGGSGFSKAGSGYDSVCDNWGGKGEYPKWATLKSNCVVRGCEMENECNCHEIYNCCGCGWNDCWCRYCFSCNACDKCLNG